MGVIYLTPDGWLYAAENISGRVFRFNVETLSSAQETGWVDIGQGSAGGTNDGAICPIYAVSQSGGP